MMGILREFSHELRRWLSAEAPRETRYLGHHCRLKKVDGNGEHPEYIRFPVCLAVQHDADLPIVYEDFSLNLCRSAAFIETESPLPEGCNIVLHFYIPPEKKLLAEFRGEVITANREEHYPHGMEICLHEGTSDSLQLLEDYLDEHRHLLDQVA